MKQDKHVRWSRKHPYVDNEKQQHKLYIQLTDSELLFKKFLVAVKKKLKEELVISLFVGAGQSSKNKFTACSLFL